jgi:hypothetical protein
MWKFTLVSSCDKSQLYENYMPTGWPATQNIQIHKGIQHVNFPSHRKGTVTVHYLCNTVSSFGDYALYFGIQICHFKTVHNFEFPGKYVHIAFLCDYHAAHNFLMNCKKNLVLYLINRVLCELLSPKSTEVSRTYNICIIYWMSGKKKESKQKIHTWQYIEHKNPNFWYHDWLGHFCVCVFLLIICVAIVAPFAA